MGSHLPHTQALTLWLAELNTYSESLEKALLPMLSASEKMKLEKISHARKYREYIVSRTLLRHALNDHFKQTNLLWQITESDNAPPELTAPFNNIFISLSHSNNLIALTLTHEATGIDIEYKKPRNNLQTMATGFMTAAEKQHLLTLPQEKQTDFFYRSWCIKEATYKLQSILNINTTPIEKICSLNDSKQAGRIYLKEAELQQHNCKLVIASQQRLGTIEYCNVTQFKLD